MHETISLRGNELGRFLAGELVGVVASVDPDGSPHAVPVWLISA